MTRPVSLHWPRGHLDWSHGPAVMGVVNVTPDSFSDGGRFLTPAAAVEQALRLEAEGAAVIDLGPASSRPGAEPVSAAEQIERVLPVIEALTGRVGVPLSIDTPEPAVARAALEAGAALINDISAGQDPAMLELAAAFEVPLVLMHMQGTPQTMQQAPHYDDVVSEIRDFLLQRAAAAETAGVPRERILLDPGIGFGKTLEHNLALLRHLDVLVETGYPVLVGTSRKRMLGDLTGRTQPQDRVFATAATVAWAAGVRVAVVRVHDVAAMVDVIKVIDALGGPMTNL